MNLDDVVQIKIEQYVKPYNPRWLCLWNPTAQDAVEAVKANPGVFVFSFDTTPVCKLEESSDFSVLCPYVNVWCDVLDDYKYEPNPDYIGEGVDLLHLVTPLYIGNFSEEHHKNIAENFIKMVLRLEDVVHFDVKKQEVYGSHE